MELEVWPPVIVSQVEALSDQLSCLGFRVQVKVRPSGAPEALLMSDRLRQGQGRGCFLEPQHPDPSCQILVFSLQRFVLHLRNHAGVRAAVMLTAWAQ